MDVEDYSTYLLEQAKSATSAFHEFRITSEPNANQIHVFVEGDEDIVFYLPEVRRRAAGRPIFSYRCGGKKSVLATRAFILEGGYKDDICLFFVDRDYDDFFNCQATPDERLLVTDVYSIENHLTDALSLEVVLTDLIGVKKNDPSFDYLFKKITQLQNSFRKKMIPILAISLSLRESGFKPNYNNLDVVKLFKITADWKLARRKGSLSEVCKAYGVAKEWQQNPAAIGKWLVLLRSQPSERAIRGKYDLSFFEHCLSVVVKDAIKRKLCPYKIKLRNNLSSGSLIDSLAGRMPPAQYISDFFANAL